MNYITSHFDKLIKSDNQAYQRWKVFLDKDRDYLGDILNQMDYPLLESIEDPRILRLIEQKARTCRTCANRSNLLTWCQTRLTVLLTPKTVKELAFARVLSYFFGLAWLLYLLVFGFSLLAFVGSEYSFTNEVTAFYFLNIWGSFWALCTLSRLRKRIKRSDLPPLFLQSRDWIIYLTGLGISICVLPSLANVFLDIFLVENVAPSYLFRLLAYFASLILLLFISGKDYIARKQPLAIPLFFSILAQTLFIILLLLGRQSLLLDPVFYVYLISFALRTYSHLKDYFSAYLPQFDSIYYASKLFRKRAIRFIWATSLLYLEVESLRNTIIPKHFLGLTLIVGLIIWACTFMVSKNQAGLDLPIIYNFPAIAPSNELIYQISKLLKRKDVHVQQWQELYLLLHSIENKGFSKTFDDWGFGLINHLPALITFMDQRRCSYLVEKCKAIGVSNLTDKTAFSQQWKMNRQSRPDLLIDLEDCFVQQLPLLKWHLFLTYIEHQEAFNLTDYYG